MHWEPIRAVFLNNKRRKNYINTKVINFDIVFERRSGLSAIVNRFIGFIV